MRNAFAGAFRFLPRWEPWALVGVQIVFSSGCGLVFRAFPEMARMGVLPLVEIPVGSLIPNLMGALIMAASMVLLLPIIHGGRGLDPGVLRPRVTTVLAGAGIAAGAQLSIAIAFRFTLSLAVWRSDLGAAIFCIFMDVAVLLCAWYVHGMDCQERGRRAPGVTASLRAGLLPGVVGLWLPGILFRWLMASAYIADMEADRTTLIGFVYLLSLAARPLFFAAWFFDRLGEGEPTAREDNEERAETTS